MCWKACHDRILAPDGEHNQNPPYIPCHACTAYVQHSRMHESHHPIAKIRSLYLCMYAQETQCSNFPNADKGVEGKMSSQDIERKGRERSHRETKAPLPIRDSTRHQQLLLPWRNYRVTCVVNECTVPHAPHDRLSARAGRRTVIHGRNTCSAGILMAHPGTAT